MPYIGHSPEVAQRRYESIDDISGSFNGSTTSFALQVGGVTPVPFPVASENVLISVGGVIQEPDGGGTNGFQLTGTNIVFSSAPASGQSFFGVILAGADYVTAGHAFPDGDAAGPSITFSQDLDTGVFRAGSGAIGFGGDGSEHARLDGSGRLLVGTTTARAAGDVTAPLQVEGTGFNTSSLNLISNAGASAGNIAHISLAKSRGTSDGSNTVVADDDNLGTVQFCGADGTDLNSVAASFGAAVDGTPGSNDMPGRLVFSTTADGASAPTERMRIDSSGNVGIDTAAPVKQLQVGAHGSSSEGTIALASTTSGTCSILMGDGGTGTDVYRGYVQYSHSDDAMLFATSASERMRINSSGDILLGDTSSTTNSIINRNAGAKMNLSAGGTGTAQIDLYGQTHSTSPKEIRMSTNGVERFKMNSSGHTQIRAASYVVEARSIASSSSSNTLYSGAHSSTGFGLGTITYEVYTNGNVKNSNNSYGSLSDANLKENIVDATSQWDDIKSLQIRKFNFREATGYDTHTQIGLVAQEVETVCPGLVQTTPVREDATPVLDAEGNALETIKSISTSVLYMKAVKALQEAQTRIETLETQNTAQQTTIADLLARVTTLEAA